jgi:hypothetical protein
VNSDHEAEHIGRPPAAEVAWIGDDGGTYTVTGRPDLVAWIGDDGGTYTVTGRPDLVEAFLDLLGRGKIDPGPAGRLELEP